jgi:hypothetical protein
MNNNSYQSALRITVIAFHLGPIESFIRFSNFVAKFDNFPEKTHPLNRFDPGW